MLLRIILILLLIQSTRLKYSFFRMSVIAAEIDDTLKLTFGDRDDRFKNKKRYIAFDNATGEAAFFELMFTAFMIIATIIAMCTHSMPFIMVHTITFILNDLIFNLIPKSTHDGYMIFDIGAVVITAGICVLLM